MSESLALVAINTPFNPCPHITSNASYVNVQFLQYPDQPLIAWACGTSPTVHTRARVDQHYRRRYHGGCGALDNNGCVSPRKGDVHKVHAWRPASWSTISNTSQTVEIGVLVLCCGCVFETSRLAFTLSVLCIGSRTQRPCCF